MKIRTAYQFVAIALLPNVLVGCGEARDLDDRQERKPPSVVAWCDRLQNELDRLGILWPIANSTLDKARIDQLEKSFESLDVNPPKELEIASHGWLEGFRIAKPYLINNDLEGYGREVDISIQEEMHLSSIKIESTCEWEGVNGG